MELLLRFLDRKQRAVHREYWGECSSATLWQPGRKRRQERKEADNLIRLSSNKCFFQTYKKAWCMCKVVVLIVLLLKSPSSLLFKSSLFSRALRMKTKSSAKRETECEALSARPWLVFCDRLNKAFYKSIHVLKIILCFFNESPASCFFSYITTTVLWGLSEWSKFKYSHCIRNYPVTGEIRNSFKLRHVEFAR